MLAYPPASLLSCTSDDLPKYCNCSLVSCWPASLLACLFWLASLLAYKPDCLQARWPDRPLAYQIAVLLGCRNSRPLGCLAAGLPALSTARPIA
jgi:hypothetical protein